MHILVAFDGSPAAERAATFVARFASPLGADVTLLGLGTSRQAETRERQLDLVSARLAELGLDVSTRLGLGRPERQLLDEIATDAYDLLVLRDHAGLGVFPPRGSAPRIVREVPLPVLVATNAPDELARILVCTGGDPPHGVGGFSLAAHIAARTHASVEVLHVMSQVPLAGDVPVDQAGLARSPEWHVEHDTSEGRHLRSFLDLFAEHGATAEARIRYGLILDQILQEAATYRADLVVLGAHGTARVLQLLLDDLTEHLIDHLDRPVLVVRPTGDGRA